MYQFTDLITKYSVPYTLIIPGVGGKYDDRGSIIPAEPVKKKRTGAIIPYDNNTVYHSGGAIAQTDRRLRSLTPLPDKLDGVHVEYGGKRYKVESDADFTTYSDFYRYHLKWVSAFDKSKAD
jgi:hypothetical protein